MTIQAPYRFVPLSNLVVLPDWSEQVSHDKPFKDGICGELEVEITTHGQVCVGGEQTPSTMTQAGKVYFYKTLDGKPAIPGSSLKGMLRNVLEISTFSRFKQVEDQKLGVRDISQAKNFYAQEIVNNTHAGWLRFEQNKWVIYPCGFARVHQKDIVAYFHHLSYSTWTDLKTVQQRYQHLGVCPTVKYKDSGEKKYNKVLAKLGEHENLIGSLIMTGQPGPFYNEKNPSQPRAAKKYEFIFYNRAEQYIDIPLHVMSGFRQIHEETKEWKFWLEKISSLEHGIPVFYHEDNQKVKSFGLAMMYKLAYTNSIYDAINHTCHEHVDGQHQQADFADLIFGYLGENEQQGLRGRVNIGLAKLSTDADLSFTQATVLSGPKPTYYPHYIQQTNTRSFNQLMQNNVKVSGWKRYPLKNVDIPALVEQNTKVQVRLETVGSGTQFVTKMRLHNVRPVELGALLWCLDFGGNQNLRHNIGMGKPYGLGQISLSIKSSKLRLNNQAAIDDANIFLKACVLEFKSYMNQILQQSDKNLKWDVTGEIKALLEYADPNNRLDLEYVSDPGCFAKLRNTENLEEFRNVFHSHQPSTVNKTLDFKYFNQFKDQISAAATAVQEQRDQEARAQLKEDANEDDKILYDLEDFISQAKKEVTKTIKSKANKIFKEPFENNWVYFNDEQKSKFKCLAREAGILIEDKSLGKTVKKIQEAE